ncbi:MAG: hypothetical protein WBM06_12620, partial [Pseudolabrys sp.]
MIYVRFTPNSGHLQFLIRSPFIHGKAKTLLMRTCQGSKQTSTTWRAYYARYQNAKTAITSSARTNPAIFM